MEGGTTLAWRPRETKINLHPFLEGSLGKETDVLVGRWVSADAVFSIDDSGEMGGDQVRTRMYVPYDERELKEGFFLFRSDGVVLELDVPVEQLDVLLDADVTHTSKEVNSRNDIDAILYKCAVTNQQCAIEILDKLVKDSCKHFPRKNN